MDRFDQFTDCMYVNPQAKMMAVTYQNYSLIGQCIPNS